MKVQIMRHSGRPVTPELLADYETAFKAAYDEIVAKHGNDMLTVHSELQKLDAALLAKFANVLMVEVPKSAKSWAKLIAQYECPVMLALSSEHKKLVMVVMDQPLT